MLGTKPISSLGVDYRDKYTGTSDYSSCASKCIGTPECMQGSNGLWHCCSDKDRCCAINEDCTGGYFCWQPHYYGTDDDYIGGSCRITTGLIIGIIVTCVFGLGLLIALYYQCKRCRKGSSTSSYSSGQQCTPVATRDLDIAETYVPSQPVSSKNPSDDHHSYASTTKNNNPFDSSPSSSAKSKGGSVDNRPAARAEGYKPVKPPKPPSSPSSASFSKSDRKVLAKLGKEFANAFEPIVDCERGNEDVDYDVYREVQGNLQDFQHDVADLMIRRNTRGNPYARQIYTNVNDSIHDMNQQNQAVMDNLMNMAQL
jgi:hypothetical protein